MVYQGGVERAVIDYGITPVVEPDPLRQQLLAEPVSLARDRVDP
jgi:hypothetical protein